MPKPINVVAFFYFHLLSVHQVGVLMEKFGYYKPMLNFIDPLFSPTHLKSELEKQRQQEWHRSKADAKQKTATRAGAESRQTQ